MEGGTLIFTETHHSIEFIMGRPSFLSALGWRDVGVMHIMVHE